MVKVGDRVRSFDFSHRRDCFVVGTVAGIDDADWDCPRYRVVAEYRVVQGEKDFGCEGTEFFPPVNGTPSLFGEATAGVEQYPEDETVAKERHPGSRVVMGW